ncbi:MAG: guanylate kinase [Rickettsiales bacterium]|jgi:guanylate kinase
MPTSPILIIISSPSGAGKSTLCKMLIKNNSNIKLSVSATTRLPRRSEIDGQHYFFISQNKFQEMLKNDHFIEHAIVFDNYYGTPNQEVDKQLINNNSVLFDIDWQGARQIVKKIDKEKVISLFILPPSMEELHRRLKTRAEDSEEVVLKRMQKAKNEMSHFDEYDHVLINEDLNETYQKIINLINSPKKQNKTEKEYISSFVQKLLK